MTNRVIGTLVRFAQLVKAENTPELIRLIKSPAFKRALEELKTEFPVAYDEVKKVAKELESKDEEDEPELLITDESKRFIEFALSNLDDDEIEG